MTPATPTPDLCLELVSNPLYLCGVREMVAQVSRRLGFNEAQSSQIALAVDEALTNIMKHGYERRTDGRIWVKLIPVTDAGGPSLHVVIEDEARQVEPEHIKSRDLEDIRPGGLGVHIMKEVMDEVRYEKRNGAGMRLTMIKKTVLTRPRVLHVLRGNQHMADKAPIIVKVEIRGTTTILAPEGEVGYHEAPTLQLAISGAFDKRPKKIIINLTGVSYMATPGLATLVEALQKGKKSSTPLVLFGLTDRVRAVFEIARLNTVFKITPDLDQALTL